MVINLLKGNVKMSVFCPVSKIGKIWTIEHFYLYKSNNTVLN